MLLIMIIIVLAVVVVLLLVLSIMQLKAAGINVKDFWGFIEANQNLDRLHDFCKKYDKMSEQEQIIYLTEAEKVFNAFDKIPRIMWEEEENKYQDVLNAYQNIRIMKWDSK